MEEVGHLILFAFFANRFSPRGANVMYVLNEPFNNSSGSFSTTGRGFVPSSWYFNDSRFDTIQADCLSTEK